MRFRDSLNPPQGLVEGRLLQKHSRHDNTAHYRLHDDARSRTADISFVQAQDYDSITIQRGQCYVRHPCVCDLKHSGSCAINIQLGADVVASGGFTVPRQSF